MEMPFKLKIRVVLSGLQQTEVDFTFFRVEPLQNRRRREIANQEKIVNWNQGRNRMLTKGSNWN